MSALTEYEDDTTTGYVFNGIEVESRFLSALRRYADHYIEAGGFLTACLRNDLREAVGRADPSAMIQIPAIVAFIYNELPGTCWGSPERVDEWLARRFAEVSP